MTTYPRRTTSLPRNLARERSRVLNRPIGCSRCSLRCNSNNRAVSEIVVIQKPRVLSKRRKSSVIPPPRKSRAKSYSYSNSDSNSDSDSGSDLSYQAAAHGYMNWKTTHFPMNSTNEKPIAVCGGNWWRNCFTNTSSDSETYTRKPSKSKSPTPSPSISQSISPSLSPTPSRERLRTKQHYLHVNDDACTCPSCPYNNRHKMCHKEATDWTGVTKNYPQRYQIEANRNCNEQIVMLKHKRAMRNVKSKISQIKVNDNSKACNRMRQLIAKHCQPDNDIKAKTKCTIRKQAIDSRPSTSAASKLRKNKEKVNAGNQQRTSVNSTGLKEQTTQTIDETDTNAVQKSLSVESNDSKTGQPSPAGSKELQNNKDANDTDKTAGDSDILRKDLRTTSMNEQFIKQLRYEDISDDENSKPKDKPHSQQNQRDGEKQQIKVEEIPSRTSTRKMLDLPVHQMSASKLYSHDDIEANNLAKSMPSKTITDSSLRQNKQKEDQLKLEEQNKQRSNVKIDPTAHQSKHNEEERRSEESLLEVKQSRYFVHSEDTFGTEGLTNKRSKSSFTQAEKEKEKK